jgi:hypothetical protein
MFTRKGGIVARWRMIAGSRPPPARLSMRRLTDQVTRRPRCRRRTVPEPDEPRAISCELSNGQKEHVHGRDCRLSRTVAEPYRVEPKFGIDFERKETARVEENLRKTTIDRSDGIESWTPKAGGATRLNVSFRAANDVACFRSSASDLSDAGSRLWTDLNVCEYNMR